MSRAGVVGVVLTVLDGDVRDGELRKELLSVETDWGDVGFEASSP